MMYDPWRKVYSRENTVQLKFRPENPEVQSNEYSLLTVMSQMVAGTLLFCPLLLQWELELDDSHRSTTIANNPIYINCKTLML